MINKEFTNHNQEGLGVIENENDNYYKAQMESNETTLNSYEYHSENDFLINSSDFNNETQDFLLYTEAAKSEHQESTHSEYDTSFPLDL